MERVGKDKLLERILADRGRFDEILGHVPRARMSEPILPGGWSVFDEYRAAIAELSEDELNGAEHFRGLSERIPGWLPWRVLYDPGHYDDHGRTIADAFVASGGAARPNP